jgi:hypothetical protein
MENAHETVSTVIREITELLNQDRDAHYQLLKDLKTYMTHPELVSYADIIRKRAERERWQIVYEEKNKQLWELVSSRKNKSV